jgi:hypothetical protein
MKAAALVAALSSCGARVVVSGERVKLVWTDGREPPRELIAAAREAKAELRDFVSKAATTHGKPAAEDTPSCWANGFARLDRARLPDDVPRRRWLQFIDDCRAFLGADHSTVGGGWAAKAAALGWGAHDLFGCNRERPFARIDQQGLLWLLNGRRLVAVTADTAVLQSSSGSRLVYRRRPTPNRVLPWELGRCATADVPDGCQHQMRTPEWTS